MDRFYIDAISGIVERSLKNKRNREFKQRQRRRQRKRQKTKLLESNHRQNLPPERQELKQ